MQNKSLQNVNEELKCPLPLKRKKQGRKIRGEMCVPLVTTFSSGKFNGRVWQIYPNRFNGGNSMCVLEWEMSAILLLLSYILYLSCIFLISCIWKAYVVSMMPHSPQCPLLDSECLREYPRFLSTYIQCNGGFQSSHKPSDTLRTDEINY